MKILICGGRNFSDFDGAFRYLDALSKEIIIDIVIEGGARGADAIGKAWATHNGVHCATVQAQWQKFGKASGPLRNNAMLYLEPDLVIAFPGGAGTAHMVKSARAKGIEVREVVL